MVTASYIFYGWWAWNYTFLLGASIVANHLFAKAILPVTRTGPQGHHVRRGRREPRGPRLLQVLRLLRDVSRRRARRTWAQGTPPLLHVILPVGISFFTFQAHQLRDRHLPRQGPSRCRCSTSRRTCRSSPTSSPDRSCGRASSCPSSRSEPTPATSTARTPFRLIVAGLFKKVVMSSYLATAIVDQVFAAPAHYSSLEILFARLRLRVPDLRRLLRLHRHRHRPRAAARHPLPAELRRAVRRSIASGLLAALAHDAVALAARLPLHPAGRQPRVEGCSTYRNLLLTMLIGGLWHGAAWTFVVWGGIHGAGLAIERLPGRSAPGARPVRARGHHPAPVRRVAHHVQRGVPGLGLLPSPTFDIAFTMLERLFTAWGTGTARDAAAPPHDRRDAGEPVRARRT